MSLAEELLNNMATVSENVETEPHIVIGTDRVVIVPDALKRIAVQHDHMIETVTFDCPRYWDKHDMSQMKIYVNYMREDGEKGSDLCTNVTIDETDENIMHFDWTITGHLSATYGPIVFLVCIQKVASNGTSANHWNSELCKDMYVSEGLEVESFVASVYPGIITALLTRMDVVEGIATEEKMQEYVSDYILNSNVDVSEIVSEHMEVNGEQYVTEYMENDLNFGKMVTESVNNYMNVNYDYFNLVKTVYRSDIPSGNLGRTIDSHKLVVDEIGVGSSFHITDYLTEKNGWYVYSDFINADHIIDFSDGIIPEGIEHSDIVMIVLSGGIITNMVTKDYIEQYKAYHFTKDSSFYITGTTGDSPNSDEVIYRIRKYTDFSALGGGNTTNTKYVLLEDTADSSKSYKLTVTNGKLTMTEVE